MPLERRVVFIERNKHLLAERRQRVKIERESHGLEGSLQAAPAKYASSFSKVPDQPCCMEANIPTNVLRSSSVALMGLPRSVSVVWPPSSVSVSVLRISSGQLSPSWGNGARVIPPVASEKELTKTSRS